MTFGPLAVLAAAGIVVGITFVFWAMLQNWMAGVIHRAQAQLGRHTYTLQSTLVVLDRLMVNGQRLVIATGRVFFRENATEQIVAIEERRTIDPKALPTEVLTRLDESQQPLTYDLSTGSVQP